VGVVKQRLVEGLATLGPLDILIGFAHGTKGWHYATLESMTHTRNTSIGASAQFWRQNRRFRGQEFVYQCSHVLKESLGGRIFRSQNDGGVAERAALEPELDSISRWAYR
jgi:hypothetical protein